ncbi:dynein associated protein-domain-containing protein [Clohesyomyces aquaticus]|uniref:Dynein associated protein-domain-containing protein n=1 Tax=Clohesyomyces aquaticus TaxID=1231657 RepID=A0A1Y1ZMV7_9PLEO|nr:dynein associated protein-domain-containing protein [Clohesyomyces aquaticus]
MAELKIGQTVETNDGRKGIIRFIGDVAVASGQFVGLELQTPTGKNDGSVGGERYFQCPAFHGLFVRPAAVSRIVSQPAPKPQLPPKAPAKQPAQTQQLKSQQTRPQPPTVAKPQAQTGAKAQAPTTAVAKPPPQSMKPRPSSMGKLSIRPLSSAAPIAASSATSRLSISQPRKSSVTSNPIALRPTKPRVPSATTPSSKGDTGALETKIHHLEQRLAEDREKLKDINKLQQERDRLAALLKKLENKCQDFHTANTGLKTQLQQSESEVERLSKIEQENESILELATLDREMAEEKAESLEVELDAVRQKLEEYELELDILRSEAEIMGSEDMSEEDKRAAGVYQLQAERDRLRQALLMMKDITEQNESDLQNRIQELESDSAQLEQARIQISDLESQLGNSSATVEDLRQQLDAALAWEDIIEDLSDQNQQFKDRLAEKDQAINDLENLKELNDELEIHHLEHETELRAELEARESELADNLRKVAQQDAEIADQEMLISKFRDLVVDLQGKMTDVESSKMMSEEQAKDVTGRFNEVMELNRRLHNASLTTTVKTITAELQKLHADEAEEELEIIKHYLPDSPDVYKNDSLQAYFRAKRINFKTSLVSSLLRSISSPPSESETVEQSLKDLLRYDALHQLAALNLQSKRLFSAVASCTLDEFVAFGSAHEDLDPIERTLERCIDSLKKDELDFEDLYEALRRSNVIMEGIIFTNKQIINARPEDEVDFLASSIASHYALLSDVLNHVKSCTLKADIVDDLGIDPKSHVLLYVGKLHEALSICSFKATKLVNTIHELRSDSLYPALDVTDVIEFESALHPTIAGTRSISREFVKDLFPAAEGEQVEDAELFKYTLELRKLLNDYELGAYDIHKKLDQLNTTAGLLTNNLEIERGPAPWVQKALEIEASKRKTAEAERQLQILTVEHHATVLQIREREEIIDTKQLEIEHLKAKHKEAAAKVERLQDVRSELAMAAEQRRKLEQQLKDQQAEIARIEEVQSSDRSVSIQPVTQNQTPKNRERNTSYAENPAINRTLLEALTNQNHWLRRRENHELFANNLRSLFSEIEVEWTLDAFSAKNGLRHPRKYTEVLEMSLGTPALELTPPETPSMVGTEYLKSPGSDWADLAHSTPMLTRSSRSRSPLVLTPIQTTLNWRPRGLSPGSFWTDIEDTSFDDMSPIAEEFASEDVEGFSAVAETTDDNFLERAYHGPPHETESQLEGFTKLEDTTLNSIIERATSRS